MMEENMIKHNKLALSALSIALVLANAPAHATNGYFLPGYGFRAQGMGGVGYAYGTDSLSIAANPANIVNTGMRGDMGVGLFNAVRHAAVGAGAGSTTGLPGLGFDFGATSDRDWFIMPEMGMTMPITEDLHVGMAFVPNGGGSTVYTQTNFFNYVGTDPDSPGFDKTLGGELMQLLVPITAGYRVNEHHAFGAALDVGIQRFRMYGIGSFQKFADTFHINLSSDPAHMTNLGYDYSFGIGGKLGWLGSFLDDKLSVGLSYTSRTYMSKFEKYKGLFAEQGDFDIPANYGVGLALKPTKHLVIAADVERIEWSSINALGDRGPGSSPANKPYPGPGFINALRGIPSAFNKTLDLGNDQGMGFGWTDQTVYKLGVNWGVNERLQLRAGYNYGKSPIPDDQLTFNTLLPVTTDTHYTVGFTYKATDELEVTGAYVRVPERSQHSPNDIQNVVGAVDIGMHQQMFALSLGWVLDPGKTDYGDGHMDPISFAGWYFGFGAGQDRVRDWGSDRFASTFAAQGVTATETSSDPTDLGIKVFAGYRFNKYLGLEGGFAQLNNFKANGTTTAPFAGTVYETDKDNVWTLAAVGTWPVTKDFSVFGKLGAGNWKRITNTWVPDPASTFPCPDCNTIRTSSIDRGTNPYYGVGASYALLDNLEVRGEYERYDVGGPKVDLLSGGLAVKF
jgi:long-chain fatty acid transport protein